MIIPLGSLLDDSTGISGQRMLLRALVVTGVIFLKDSGHDFSSGYRHLEEDTYLHCNFIVSSKGVFKFPNRFRTIAF